MSEEVTARAKRILDTARKVLDEKGWHYDAREEDNVLFCELRSDDFPIDIKFIVNEKLELAILYSKIPVTISEGKRVEAAVAVNMVNNILVDGCFEYHIDTGIIYFRLTNSFTDTDLSGSLINTMIMRSCGVVDDYNDRFFMLDKGVLSLEDFIIKE